MLFSPTRAWQHFHSRQIGTTNAFKVWYIWQIEYSKILQFVEHQLLAVGCGPTPHHSLLGGGRCRALTRSLYSVVAAQHSASNGMHASLAVWAGDESSAPTCQHFHPPPGYTSQMFVLNISPLRATSSDDCTLRNPCWTSPRNTGSTVWSWSKNSSRNSTTSRPRPKRARPSQSRTVRLDCPADWTRWRSLVTLMISSMAMSAPSPTEMETNRQKKQSS